MSPTSSAATVSESAPHSVEGKWRRHRPVLMGLALTLLAVVGIVGWRVVAAHTLDDVAVQVTDYDCRGDGTTVRSKSRVTTVRTARNMRCTFSVQVVNDSGRGVHLGEVRATVMGPQTGSVIRAESIDGATPRSDDTGIDALHRLDRSVGAGESTTFDIVAAFNPQGCNDDGTLSLHGFPQLEVSALGVDRTIGAPDTLAFRNTIRTPGCRNL